MEDKYIVAKVERSKHVEAILQSDSPKKVVVAGPGTGKTYLFKEILKNKKNTITLTFINALVEDLSLELYGISEVRTLHGFARSILGNILKNEIKIHPKLSRYIQEDAQILLGQDIDFNKIFHERDDKNDSLNFYENRRKYYEYYGYTDVIYAAVKCFETKNSTIPAYEQILVDEFQDFNLLEVSLIDLLATKSPILLAGDDDQALYQFKQASAQHIRDRHGEGMPEYKPFNLPFCSRCPRVIIEATTDLITNAQENGFLKGRIKKPYSYFIDKDKDKVSDNYPAIAHSHYFEKQFSWFIEKYISDMALSIKDKFSVLIISPYQKKSKEIVDLLRKKGFSNIEFTEKLDEDSLTLLDGFNLLCEDLNDNLGWRIIARFVLSNEDFVSIIKNSASDSNKKIYELLPRDCIKEVNEITKALKAIIAGKQESPEMLSKIFKRFNIGPYQTATEFLKLQVNSLEQRSGIPALRKIPIKATTIQSSKGLAADVVFITHFDDRYFIKDKEKKDISDQEICNFLVALTRAKKKVFLLSSVNEIPVFLNWISKDRIERVK